ncbi:unnamed protein product (macronuclear) [Paramecium tetraurelia]|uniref:RING-type domain-containing protein n=1 Tax=Paramecium tetraurelia TaxID=5888 RepID=A0CJN6_PARTE|nr:uncharacterized protein GSPATT00000715001 [Paramecium tetraurelia]CAK71003.1 unnamed protein product [Paramecium tetraurelia]|eukprot:XP_001438400.1 hypothetical protein (macronuclear) [Paramecium tetraurelia strain d4-2]
MNQFQKAETSSFVQNYYMTRESLLNSKQTNFNSILQKFQLNNEDQGQLKIIIDQTNQKLELPNSLDLKFASSIPTKIDEQIQYLIINETIETDSQNVEQLQSQCIPEYNMIYTFLWKENMERVDQIYEYLLKYIHEEQDVLIYCKNVNEIQSFANALELLGQIQVRLTPEFNDFYQKLDQRKTQQFNHVIYLLIEPQYLESECITLIIHTQYKEIRKPYIQNSVIYQDHLLSRQELIIREIPKSNQCGVQIIYNFPKETYVSLSPKEVQLEFSQQDHHIEEFDKSKNSAIIKGALNTSGMLFQNKPNFNLTIRTSLLWSNKGDAYSWIEIIDQLGTFINSILLNVEFDKNQSIFEFTQLEKWCDENQINLYKGILILLYVQQYTQEYNCPQFNILNIGGLSMAPIRRSSSMQVVQEDKPQVEEQLKLNFPVAELREDRLYHIQEQSYKLNQGCIQKQKGRLQQYIYILALKENSILYLHNKNRKQSLTQKEIILTNVGNVILEELWKNQGIEITELENKYNCSIEPNLNLNLISIYSDDKVDMGELYARIDQIKENLKTQILEIKHISGKKLIFQSGAVISEWIKQHESKEFKLVGLPPKVTEGDIKELFEDFTVITHLKLNYLENETQAQIVIEDKDDMPYIIQGYDQSEYQDRIISVVTEQTQIQLNKINQQKYILSLIWYTKLCSGVCTVVFNETAQAKGCLDQFNNQLLEGKQIKITQIDEFTLKFQNLSPFTTEIDILMLCGGKQHVKYIDLQSKTLSESKEDYSQIIIHLINRNIERNEKKDVDFHHTHLIRKTRGKRKAKIYITSIHTMQKLLEILNGQKIQFGANLVKIHSKGQYYQYHKIPIQLKPHILSLLKEYEKFNFKVTFEQGNHQKNRELEVIICTYNILVNQQLDQVITNFLQGYKIELKNTSDFLFTPFGQNKLKDFEKADGSIHFMIDQYKKVIRVCCQKEKLDEITNYVNQIAQIIVSHKLIIPPGAIKQLVGLKGQGLDSLKKQFNLTQIKYKQQSKELFLEGSGLNIQDAVSCIESAVSQVNFDEETIISDAKQEDCPICFDKIIHSYLLQGCGHKCCLECISLHCNSVLQDVKLFPVRCPICNEKMILNDILQIIGKENKETLINLALNKFVQENNQSLTFCYTPGCNNFEQIQIEDKAIYCSMCLKQYCFLCKALRHPGLTCEENKLGDQGLLLKLMKEQDIRKCPSCQALIQRIDGCYRVTCSVCNKSICWKDNKKGVPCMQVFKTASECYDHLSKYHGGYW